LNEGQEEEEQEDYDICSAKWSRFCTEIGFFLSFFLSFFFFFSFFLMMFVFLLFSNLLWDNVDDGDAVLCGRDLYTNSAHIDIFAIVRPAIVTILQETVDYFLDKTVDQVRV
jgi:hypothetical protein